jgi:hypothetical protein
MRNILVLCTELFSLDLDTSWRWVSVSSPWRFFPGKQPRCPFDRSLGLRAAFDDTEKLKFLPLSGFEFRTLSSPSRKQSLSDTKCVLGSQEYSSHSWLQCSYTTSPLFCVSNYQYIEYEHWQKLKFVLCNWRTSGGQPRNYSINKDWIITGFYPTAISDWFCTHCFFFSTILA